MSQTIVLDNGDDGKPIVLLQVEYDPAPPRYGETLNGMPPDEDGNFSIDVQAELGFAPASAEALAESMMAVDARLDALESAPAPDGTVSSVAGKTGDVDLNKADVGLPLVDNTSDANKPVSNDTQTALNAKQATLVSGTNIKTINSQSLLGSGDITITGTSGKTIVWFTVENTTAVTTGEKQAMVPCPVSGTIVGWSMTANPSTSAAISIWKAAGVRPTVAGKITASAPPTLTAAASASSTTLTGWNTAVTAGDLFVMNVDSNSAATWLYVALEIQ